MAVSKLWAVKHSLSKVIDYASDPRKTKYTPEQYQALRDVIAYASNEEKTEHELFVEGINCNPATAREQFITVKKQCGKTDGIQAYHGYLSFKETDITPELAQKVGMEFASKVWGERFQVIVTTHLNTKHLHCHFVINSVSFVDGKRCQDTSWFKFRKVADRICEKYNLYYNDTPNRSKQSDYLSKLEREGKPTRYTIVKEAIDEAISHSSTKAEFEYYLKKMGYTVNLSQSRKYWTVIPKGYSKPIRLKNLGEEYTNSRITERLKENRGKKLIPFSDEKPKAKQYNLPTREDKIKKHKGLYGLYLYYCYRLGYLPKYKGNNTKLHYILKEDLIKMEEFSREMRFLGKYRIETKEQLLFHKEGCMREIKTLVYERARLRNKVRTNITDEELKSTKEEISQLTVRLRELRKEVRLCEKIYQRSDEVQEKLEKVLADEGKRIKEGGEKA